MQVSTNTRSYDSRVTNNNSVSRTRSVGTVKQFLEAFRVDLSRKALLSEEFNNPSIKFPTHNTDVLQYSSNLNLILKP